MFKLLEKGRWLEDPWLRTSPRNFVAKEATFNLTLKYSSIICPSRLGYLRQFLP